MRSHVLALALALAAGAAGCGEPGPTGGSTLWGRRFGKSTSPDRVAVAVDGAGNAVVGGRFFATADLGGGPVTSPANNWQAFVAKYDGDGAPLWSRSLGGIYEENVTNVAADGAGNVYVAGTFRGTIDFGGGALEGDGSGDDLFVAKLAPDGSHLWSKRLGSASYDSLITMSVNAQGDVALAGSVGAAADFGDGPMDLGYSLFVAKLGADGTVAYAVPFTSGPNYAYSVTLALDSAGAIVAAANFYGNDGIEGTYLTKLGPTGQPVWSRSVSSPGGQIHTNVLALGSDDVIHLAGEMHGDIDLGDGVTSAAKEDSEDGFVAALAPDGAARWLSRLTPRRMSTDGDGYVQYGTIMPNAIAVSSGEVAVTGYFSGEVDLGGGVRKSVKSTKTDAYYAPDGDIFALMLNGGGQYVWDATFGNGANQAGTSVGLDPAGDAFVAGYANGALPFAAGEFANTDYYDAFVVKIAR
jgi:hypothetical protein